MKRLLSAGRRFRSPAPKNIHALDEHGLRFPGRTDEEWRGFLLSLTPTTRTSKRACWAAKPMEIRVDHYAMELAMHFFKSGHNLIRATAPLLGKANPARECSVEENRPTFGPN